MRKRRIYKARPSVDGGLCCHACLCVRLPARRAQAGTQTGASSPRAYHTSYPVSVRLPVRCICLCVPRRQAQTGRPALLDWASSRPHRSAELTPKPRDDALALLLPSCLRAARKQVGSTLRSPLRVNSHLVRGLSPRKF